MTAPLSLSDFRAAFNPVLTGVMSEHTAAAQDLDTEYGRLLETLSAFMARGGKRLRPYLAYLAYVGSDGPADQIPAFLRAATSQELYHTAWLIHDDIIDRDLVRYGGPNIAGHYRTEFSRQRVPGGRHLADSLALLSGDINANLATQLILDSPFAPEARLAAAACQTAANFEVFGGETLDLLLPTLSAKSVSEDRILNLYQAKTASYSFRAPLQVGSLLAGAPASDLTEIPTFAHHLGLAYQLSDDLLGTFSNEQKLGKSVLTDLREGKRTLLLTLALKMSTPADRRYLETVAGNAKSGYRQLAEVRAIYDRSGAHAACQNLAHHHIDSALAVLPELHITAPVATELTKLAFYLIDRPV